MKVDTINTKFGNIEIEYSTFTKGFYVKNYPEKMEQIKGLNLLKTRNNSFKEFEKLENYIKELVHNALVDFEFERKVIIYKLRADNSFRDSLSIEWMVCNESAKMQKHGQMSHNIREYYVVDSNMKKYIGKRNIFGQLTNEDSSEYIFIDFDETVYQFFLSFTENFQKLKESLFVFFSAENVIQNIMSNKDGKLLLGK